MAYSRAGVIEPPQKVFGRAASQRSTVEGVAAQTEPARRFAARPASESSAHSADGELRKMTSRLAKSNSAEELLQHYSEQSTMMNAVHVSTFWQRLSYLLKTVEGGRANWLITHGERLVGPREQTIRELIRMDPQVLTFTAASLAALRVSTTKDPQMSALWSAVARAAESRAANGELSPKFLAGLAYSVARSGHPDRALFDTLAAVAAPIVDEFKSARELASLAWAFARQRHTAPPLFEALEAHALPRLGEWNVQVGPKAREKKQKIVFSSPPKCHTPTFATSQKLIPTRTSQRSLTRTLRSSSPRPRSSRRSPASCCRRGMP